MSNFYSLAAHAALPVDEVVLFPGSRWLYFKLYMNQNAMDEVLVTILHRLSEHFQTEFKKPVSYFFVRYFDTAHHVRLRFQVETAGELGELIWLMNQVATATPSLTKVVVDTYVRETERYGVKRIATVEELFMVDTQLVVGFLEQHSTNALTDVERLAYAVQGVQEYLEAFGYTGSERLAFVRTTKENFFHEFQVDLLLKKRLNQKFASLQDQFIQESAAYAAPASLISKKYSLCSAVIDQLDPGSDKDSIVWSIIHMFMNRIFNRNQRYYEMIAYDFCDKKLQRAKRLPQSALV